MKDDNNLDFVHFCAVIAKSGKGVDKFGLRFVYITLNVNQAIDVKQFHSEKARKYRNKKKIL